MNYGYDYRSYFQEITGDLDDLLSNQGDLITEVRQLHTDSNDRLDLIADTLHDCLILFSGLLVVSCVLSVIFK